NTIDGGFGNDTLVVQLAPGKSMPSFMVQTDAFFHTYNVFSSGLKISNFESVVFQQTLASGGAKLVGIEGNDLLSSSAGADSLIGGGGSDTLRGSGGNDTLLGGAGEDSIDAGSDNDRINGGLGNDTLQAGSGNDTLADEGGNDSIDGGDGNDRLTSGAGNDTILGGAGTDTLAGGADNDSLDGGADNDRLDGGDGDDTLAAGTGNDTLGGAGADVFRFGDLPGSGARLGDFLSGTDMLEFSVWAFAGLSGDALAAGQFNLGAAVGTGAQFVYLGGSVGVLDWAANGTAGPLVKIATLAGHPALTAGDFHLVA
ncbi:MAG: calcium-binding protein, partial [Paracraurococcus sp.]